jgi:hypothetical protein
MLVTLVEMQSGTVANNLAFVEYDSALINTDHGPKLVVQEVLPAMFDVFREPDPVANRDGGLVNLEGGKVEIAGLLLNTADGAAASTGASSPGTIVLANSTISVSGLLANGLLVSGSGSSISIFNSNVVSSLGNGALVENGANLTLTGSNLTALVHGIVAAGGTVNTPNSILVSGGNVTTVLGDAFRVLNGVSNITVNNGATVTGTTALLRVLIPKPGLRCHRCAGSACAGPAARQERHHLRRLV